MKARHKRARRQRRKANGRRLATFDRLMAKMREKPRGIVYAVDELAQFSAAEDE